MHTPEEAGTLWCPMARVGVLPSAGGPSGVNDPETQFHINCIADKCAMWRWKPKTIGNYTTYAPGLHPGYCGLAGNPATN